MSIEVGINRNVVIEKVEISDHEKGTLTFHFRSARAEGEEKKEINGFEMLAADGYAETGSSDGKSIRLFCPLKPFDVTSEGKPVPAADQQKAAMDAIGEKKNILFQILCVFMTSDKAKLDIFRDSGITMDNFPTRIVQESTLEKLMLNLAQDFVRLMAPFVDKDEHAVNILLPRKKNKPYPDFRDRFVKENPFIEDARVPEDASKLKFNKHELANKLNEPLASGQSEADEEAEKEEAQSAASIFGEQ